jgi:AcrR family transcriptional regulator
VIAGRRPGNHDTRDTILVAARDAFAAKGFARTTIRSIAADARVDPALIHHYFGTKEKLFLAALKIPVDPGAIIAQVVAGPVDSLGTRLAGTVLGMWESPAGASLHAVLRSAMTEPAMARMIREFIAGQIVARLLREIRCAPAETEQRGALLVSQIAGVLVGRHLLALEPLASRPLGSLIPDLGATLQRYLVGPLAG